MNVVPRVIDFKYNPGFKEDRDLQDDFIVRKKELRLLLNIIEENTDASSNRHVLLIGPRGAGKTTLARRIQAELRLNPDLSKDWFPIAFGEEGYSITSAGEFWLECVYHLQKSLNSDQLEQRYQELRNIQNDDTLLEAAVTTVIDQAHALRRRFLLIVENLNILLEQQMSERDAWAFRHTLQNHSEIMLLATATSSFTQIESEDMALFDQFKVHYVGPLSAKDCRILWFRVSGDRLRDQQVRPIQILTGGNPRLIRILAEFAIDNVFFQLVNKLAFMIDQYTDYFKSQLDLLPAAERKVFVALLELWDPVITRDVAKAARVTTNTAGAYLDRLERRGAVTKEEGRWQATERLFNIYYLMRRRGAPSSRVHALVRFMTVYYAPDQLATRVRELAAEACRLKPAERQDHYYAVSALVTQFAPGDQRRVVSAIPTDFFQGPNVPDPIVRLRSLTDVSGGQIVTRAARARGKRGAADRDVAQFERVFALLSSGNAAEAEVLAQDFVKASGGSVPALYTMAVLHAAANRTTQAEESIQRVLSAAPENASAWQFLANLLLDDDRPEEALKATQHLTQLDGTKASQWILLASAADQSGQDSGVVEAAFRKALELDSDQDDALVGLAKIAAERRDLAEARSLFERAMETKPLKLSTLGQYGDFLAEVIDDDDAAETVFRDITERFPDEPQGWTRFAIHIASDPTRREEARRAFETATAHADTDARPWVAYAEFLNLSGDLAAAEAAWRSATELDPEAAELWVMFGVFLSRNDRSQEAERAFLRAIELDPEDAQAWERLGLLLLNQTERAKEAESAFLEAAKRAPTSCSPLASLGQFYESQGRLSEADAQYRRALELRPECGCALESLLSKRSGFGRDLADADTLINRLLEKYPESPRARLVSARYQRFARANLSLAKVEILKAISTGKATRDVWLQAAEILIESDLAPDEALREFMAQADEHQPCEHMLNEVSWQLHLKYGARAADFALAVGRRALAMDPDSWQIAHTVVAILTGRGDFDEAMSLVPMLLAGHRDTELAGLIDILIDLVRADEDLAVRILREIEAADQVNRLEPLVVALRMLTGQEARVAKEIMEVATDIIARIKGRELVP